MKEPRLLQQLNLHHLRALDALLAERNVTRAASRLGMTQSAVSHALGGLREALGDPLLVRGRGRMVPTPRAEALAGPLHAALLALEAALVEGPRFDPATANRTFVMAMGDAFSLTLLPQLLRIVRQEAPGVDLDVRPAPGGSSAVALERGDVDLAFGVDIPNVVALRTRALFEDSFACLVREGHPEVGATLDLDTFCRLPHALMSPEGSGPGVVDRVLAELGRSRRVALRIRYFVAAPLVVSESDLILTGPRRQLTRLAQRAPLRVLEPPMPMPHFTTRMIWHLRAQEDPAHRWLREAVVRALREG